MAGALAAFADVDLVATRHAASQIAVALAWMNAMVLAWPATIAASMSASFFLK